MTPYPPAAPPDSGVRAAGSPAGLLAIGGLLGALAASTCCILPFVLVSMGLGGAWLAKVTGLGSYHPTIMVITGGVLAGGFWAAYQRPDRHYKAGQQCSRPAGRLVKTTLWGATLLLVAVLLLPDLVPVFAEG